MCGVPLQGFERRWNMSKDPIISTLCSQIYDCHSNLRQLHHGYFASKRLRQENLAMAAFSYDYWNIANWNLADDAEA